MKEHFFKDILGKKTISCKFSYKSYVKFDGKKIGSINMTVFYPKSVLKWGVL